MVEISIMIEGQVDMGWDRWQRLVRATEDLGFDGLYRSDHFTQPVAPPRRDSLELMVSLTWLATNTSRIRFGALVSPISFRDPVTLAWQSSGIDALAGGRLDLGLGAGWNEAEHAAFGYDLLAVGSRFQRFAEGIQVVRLLTRAAEPVTFSGEFFTLKNAMLMPRSPLQGGPPITIGGAGRKRTMPLVAKYADEWNCVHLPVAAFREVDALLADLLEREGRPRHAVRRTMMASVFIGLGNADVTRRLGGKDRAEMLASGQFAGSPAEILEQMQPYLDAGIDGFKLRLPDLDDLAALELVARELVPHLRAARPPTR